MFAVVEISLESCNFAALLSCGKGDVAWQSQIYFLVNFIVKNVCAKCVVSVSSCSKNQSKVYVEEIFLVIEINFRHDIVVYFTISEADFADKFVHRFFFCD